ncbi:MAG: spore germination protein [Chitinophagales bacterium]
MAHSRKPPKQPNSLTDAIRRLWKASDPEAEPRPTEFSLGNRPAHPSNPPAPENTEPDLSRSLEDNLARLRQALHADLNSDVVFRQFELGFKKPRRAFLLYVEGLVDKATENQFILEPLMLLVRLRPELPEGEIIRCLAEHLTPATSTSIEQNLGSVIDKVLTGITALFVEGSAEALLIETKGWKMRSIDKPSSEPAVRGPQEAFTETLRVNTALVRRRLRTKDLVVEALPVGNLSKTDVALIYIQGLTNPKLVEEVRRRLRGIKMDYAASSGMIEHMLVDHPHSPFPQVMPTERPDRVAASVAEGYVAVIVDTSPFALVLPATFTSAIHSAEDYYILWPLASFARLIRVAAMLTSLLLPGFYIAAVSYHSEMLPTPLLLAIAGSRLTIPFPLWLEVLIMEFSFQLVREAGVRIPSVIGPTIGIVGALILGQASVAANLISPIPVVLVALTALGSFLVPNYQASYTLQVARFAIIVAGSVFGFYGIVLAVYVMSLHLVSLTSFGVPMVSPVGPYEPGSGDLILVQPTSSFETRPSFLRPVKERKQPNISRQWDMPEPTSGQSTAGQEESDREPSD